MVDRDDDGRLHSQSSFGDLDSDTEHVTAVPDMSRSLSGSRSEPSLYERSQLTGGQTYGVHFETETHRMSRTHESQRPHSARYLSHYVDPSAVDSVFDAVQPTSLGTTRSSSQQYLSGTSSQQYLSAASSQQYLSASSSQQYLSAASSTLSHQYLSASEELGSSGSMYYSATEDLDTFQTRTPAPPGVQTDKVATERVQQKGVRSHETFDEPCVDREEHEMVVEIPAVEHSEEFLVVESPRSTCTPSSVTSQSQVFTFQGDDASPETGSSRTSESHVYSKTTTSQQVVIVPEIVSTAQSAPTEEEPLRKGATAPPESTELQAEEGAEASPPKPPKKQLSEEEEEFIKCAQFEIDAMVISLDTTTENASQSENGSELEESDVESVDLDIRQRKEFDPRRHSVKPLTEITVDVPTETFITESLVEEEEAKTVESIPQPPQPSLQLPTTTSTELHTRPRSPWQPRERIQVPEGPTERIVSFESSSLVLAQSVVTKDSDSGVQTKVPKHGLPVELLEADVDDDPELVTAFEKPGSLQTEAESSSQSLTLKPQWMVRPTSPWAKENLEKQTSKTDPAQEAALYELKPSGRESPKLFEYSSSSDDVVLEEKLPSFDEMAPPLADSTVPIVTAKQMTITETVPSTSSSHAAETELKDAIPVQGQDQAKGQESEDFIIVDPVELLREGDALGDTGPQSDPHTQSETFSDYDINFEPVTSEVSSTSQMAPPTGSGRTGSVPDRPSIKLDIKHTGDLDEEEDDLVGEVDFSEEFAKLGREKELKFEDEEETGLSLKPQWLVRPTSPWSHEKMAEMSHPLSPKIASQPEIHVTGTSGVQEPMTRSLTEEHEKLFSVESSEGSSLTISDRGSSMTISDIQDRTGSSDTLDYDADEEISSGSEVLQSPRQGKASSSILRLHESVGLWLSLCVSGGSGGVQKFSISCSFSENLAKSYVGAPWRVGAPPAGNPGSGPVRVSLMA